MMAKRKYDDVEEEDSISDDRLNHHYDELEKQQYDGEICDNQLNELNEQLDQQQLDALNIELGMEQSGGALFNFEFQNAGFRKIGKRQRINKDTRPPSSRHELHPKTIISEKKLQMR